MIITLTINPAIDRNVSADRLAFEDRGYILSTSESAGGRGINASLVIHSFGGKTLGIVPSGGPNAQKFRDLVNRHNVPVEFVPTEQEIRTNLTISDQQGLTVKLNEPGSEMSAQDLQRVKEVVEKHLEDAAWLMLCGSTPPGVPSHFYCELIEMARHRGVRTLLDADGDSLLHGLEAKPTAVAPNQQEAERLLNRAIITRPNFRDAAERIRAMGAESVVLSLGSRGAVGKKDALLVEAVPPRIDAVCPIGAGDALAAAFVWASNQNKPFEEALRWGVAAGTASAKLPGIRFASLPQTRSMFKQVELHWAQ